MDRVPASALKNIGQMESFLEIIYNKAMDLLEANMERIACMSVTSVASPSTAKCANLFLEEVTGRAISIFCDKFSKLGASPYFQFGFLSNVPIRRTPPMAGPHMHVSKEGSLLERGQNVNNGQVGDIQSGWPLTLSDTCFYGFEGNMKMQQMHTNASNGTTLGGEVQTFTNFIERSPHDKSEINVDVHNGKHDEPMVSPVSVIHTSIDVPSCIDVKGLETIDLKELTPQENKNCSDSCHSEFTGFHSAANLLQSPVYEKQLDSSAVQQCKSIINEFDLKSFTNVPQVTIFDGKCSAPKTDSHESLEDCPPAKYSTQLISDGSAEDSEEVPEMCSGMEKEDSSIAKDCNSYQDQEVPDSHLINPGDEEESSLFYSWSDIKGGTENSHEAEQVSSCAEALGCHWFTGTLGPGLMPSRGNFNKLPSIPVCNRRRRVGLSRKQKVPHLHTKRQKISEQ